MILTSTNGFLRIKLIIRGLQPLLANIYLFLSFAPLCVGNFLYIYTDGENVLTVQVLISDIIGHFFDQENA